MTEAQRGDMKHLKAEPSMHFCTTSHKTCSGHLFYVQVQGPKPESSQEHHYKENYMNHAWPSRCMGALLLPWRPVNSPCGSQSITTLPRPLDGQAMPCAPRPSLVSHTTLWFRKLLAPSQSLRVLLPTDAQ